jgi:hypothetical protein
VLVSGGTSTLTSGASMASAEAEIAGTGVKAAAA